MKVLLVDVETFPILMYAWQAWEASSLRIVEDTSLASFSAKWLGGKHITKTLCDYEGYRPGSRDDKALVAELARLLDEADIVVAHNLDKFDARKINARIIINGLSVPSPYQAFDTLKEARKHFAFDSNKLNEICRVLRVGTKVKTGGADLWFDCLAGNEVAWRRMKKYNAHDVRLLEGVYLQLRPWAKRHPRVSDALDACPKCGSSKLQSRGTMRSATRTYQRWQCGSCGGWAKSVKSESSVSITNAA